MWSLTWRRIRPHTRVLGPGKWAINCPFYRCTRLLAHTFPTLSFVLFRQQSCDAEKLHLCSPPPKRGWEWGMTSRWATTLCYLLKSVHLRGKSTVWCHLCNATRTVRQSQHKQYTVGTSTSKSNIHSSLTPRLQLPCLVMPAYCRSVNIQRRMDGRVRYYIDVLARNKRGDAEE